VEADAVAVHDRHHPDVVFDHCVEDARRRRAGIFTLLLGATLGMSLMASTTNLLMLFMAVEMASLPSYVLAGFRKTNRIGAEASLKYVLFGAATSAVMVYGLSMLMASMARFRSKISAKR